MQYKGRYRFFNFSKVKTYPIVKRKNIFHIKDLIKLEDILKKDIKLNFPNLEKVADEIYNAVKNKKPIVIFSGAHLVKNGLSPILIDLMRRKIITLVAGNGAFAIHDFEIALQGETSEDVPTVLNKGEFGFSYETNKFINKCIKSGNKLKLGFGESLGMFIQGKLLKEKLEFKYPDLSVLGEGYRLKIPVTIHITVGADIIHQTSFFDGEATGGCSARDFGIFVAEIMKFKSGGVFLNIGSAVTGPEVLLKAVSICANIKSPPKGIITCDFDIRKIEEEISSSRIKPQYFYRDIKSVVNRIPEAFGGKGYYIFGDQKETIPALYKLIINKLENG